MATNKQTAREKITLRDQVPARTITINPFATYGAQFGVNVYAPNGVLVDLADLLNTAGETPGSSEFVYWIQIQEIPPNIQALAAATGTGLYTITGAGTSATREIQGTVGRITVANGSGVAGDPGVDLAVVPDSGVGAALVKITRDTFGRVTGMEAALVGDLADVDLTGLADGDVLVWDAATSTWKPGAGGGGGGVWGTITGTLSDQTDLWAALESKLESIVAGTGIDVDATDPKNPIVSISGSVLSVIASALQPGDNVSDLVNDAGYLTSLGPMAPLLIQASAALTAGDFIRIHDSGGARVRPADRSTALADGRADGFVLANVLLAATATVYQSGVNTALAGLTPGVQYVLDNAGGVVDLASLPAVAGEILQCLGVASSATALAVNIDEPILRG